MIRLLAPAKINLTLRVLRRRSDGYHDIESLVQKVSLYDGITISESGVPGIRVTCSEPGIPTGPENLVHKAAEALMKDAGRSDRGVSIHLEKHIPHGAGLGGGSSDAATVLMGLDRMWDLSTPREKLEELAAGIGSDVPLFLHPSPSIITGRGETVRAAPVFINAVFLILFPGFSVSTKWAYANFRLTKKYGKYRISGLYEAEGGELSPDLWQSFLVNDLEAAVTERHPEIAQCKEDLIRMGAKASLMSGSGSAVFGLFEDKPSALDAADGLSTDEGRSARVALPIFS